MFPTPYKVFLHTRLQSVKDERGRKTETWHSQGLECEVMGWAPPTPDMTLTDDAGERLAKKLDLLVPPDFSCGHRDKIIIDNIPYIAIGEPQDFTKGPFGFRPGKVVHLERFEEHA